jgi:predicted ArsR family transcriptional regulator
VREELAAQASGIGALSDPVRRALYQFVVSRPTPVSREQAATETSMAPHSVKFHLDRMVDEGLLEVEFRRLTGRSGPGAGRPAKLYRRSDNDIAVSLPERHYDLVGRILAGAVQRSMDEQTPVGDAVEKVACEVGLRAGEDAGADSGGAGDAADLDRAAGLLARYGYEPRVEPPDVMLANCPFDRLAKEHTELVCGLNLGFVAGALEGLGCARLRARLDPGPDRCCVRITEQAGRRNAR